MFIKNIKMMRIKQLEADKNGQEKRGYNKIR